MNEFLGKFRLRSEMRSSEPVMTDHPFFIRIGKKTGFEFIAGVKRPGDFSLHTGEEV